MTTTSLVWPDARAAADAMVSWYRQHRHTPNSCEHPWDEVTTVLAVSLCRLADDQQTRINDTDLSSGHIFAYLQFVDRLFDRPLPAGMDTPMPSISDHDPVLRCADAVIRANRRQYREGSELGPTDDLKLVTGTPAGQRRAMLAAFTIGDRLHDLVDAEQTLPDLVEDDDLRQCARAAEIALNRRDWVPSNDEVRIAEAVLAAIRVHPELPLTDVFEASWLARLRRLARAGHTLQEFTLDGMPPLLTHVVSAIVRMVDATTQPLARLNEAWSTRREDQRLPHWERAHIPIAVRRRIRAAEDRLFRTGTVLRACVTGHVDH